MSIGTEFNPIGADFSSVYAQLAKAREQEPVFRSEEFGCWVVTRYDDIISVFEDDDCFTVKGVLGGLNTGYAPEASRILSGGVDWRDIEHIQNSEGDQHMKIRLYLQKILSPIRFRKMEPKIREITNGLIDRFVNDGRCEFVSQFCYPLPIYTVFRLVGFHEDEEDMEQLQRWSDNTFRMWLEPMEADEQARCAQDAVDFQQYMRDKMEERRRSPRDDVMTAFVQAIDSGEYELTDDELIIMFTHNIIGAGHETTKAQLSNLFYQLLKEPSRLQALQEHPEQVEDFVEEIIRYDASVLGWYRIASRDTELAGANIKAGELVYLALGAANHDASKFKDAESFCPVRVNRKKPLTFTHGSHFCPGAPLARLELKIALEELLRRLPNLRLLDPDAEVKYQPSLPTRVINELHLAWD